MSLTSDLKSPKTPVGSWARQRFPNAKLLYSQLTAAAEPAQVRPTGWGDGRDQRWSWSGMACDTMLRWHLGASEAARPARTGARLLVGDLDQCDLGRLLAGAPTLEDATAAARVAVLWALAEQHARYRLTENPLTSLADQPTGTLLAAVPDDVVADVAAVIEGPAARLPKALSPLGKVEAGVALTYPDGADLDLLLGRTLVEIKTTIARPSLTDVLQALGYALLAEPGSIDELAWVFPRSGKHLRLSVEEVIGHIVDAPGITATVLREELQDAAGLSR